LVESPSSSGVYTAAVDSKRVTSLQSPVPRTYRVGFDSLIGFGRLENEFCKEIDVLLNTVVVQVPHDVFDCLGLGDFVKVPGSVFSKQLRQQCEADQRVGFGNVLDLFGLCTLRCQEDST